jgi:hypothetical protein
MARETKKHGIAVRGAWLPVGLDFLRSRACAELSSLGAKLLLDVMSMLGPNATRNGDISLAPKVMAVRGWASRSSLAAAVQELLQFGLLVRTKQGTREDCSLYACALYPLDCDLSKLDVRPGCYLTTDYMQQDTLAKPPTELNPATWRYARKTQTVAPPRDKVSKVRPATGQSARLKPSK